jgi:hypothetical protein
MTQDVQWVLLIWCSHHVGMTLVDLMQLVLEGFMQ